MGELSRAAWIIGAAVMLRLAAFFTLGGSVPPYDPATYLELAQGLLAGEGLVRHSPMFGELHAAFPPLYPLLLAGAGGTLLSALFLNIALDILAAIGLRRASGGWLAPALMLFWPTLVLNALIPQKEGLMIALVAWAMVFAIERRAIALGIACGLLMLTQPALALLPVLLAVTHLDFRGVLQSGVAGLLAIAPWIVRNFVLLGKIIPFTTSFPIALSVMAFGRHTQQSDELLMMGEMQRLEEVQRLALDRLDPASYVELVVRNAFDALARDGRMASNFGLPEWPFTFAHLVMMAMLVAVAIAQRSRLAAIFFLTMVPMVFLEFGQRHRYFLFPLAALLIAGWLADRRGKTAASPVLRESRGR